MTLKRVHYTQILIINPSLQAELTKQQNDFKIKLKELEDSLLSRLSSAGGNFLGDTELVENLEITKRTAAEIEQKVTEYTSANSHVDGAHMLCCVVLCY